MALSSAAVAVFDDYDSVYYDDCLQGLLEILALGSVPALSLGETLPHPLALSWLNFRNLS